MSEKHKNKISEEDKNSMHEEGRNITPEEDINNIIEKKYEWYAWRKKINTTGMLKRISRDKKSSSIIIIFQ